ncbi:enoyl-CoA hydratase [Paracoccus sp. S-4012]|uniref:oxepin-CoA hydrolase, alternative type n=1 Tax=Paracoccus sp. S-4012 TaxID=2665648 RepID=UPI0012B0EEF2|nr:enoyl-CoA hydratase family protein [Paracoccus sp. S-4012]MRX49256.1 enoyl-CoA hydratase [Paracoccus sp. S-4012]
MTETCEIIDEGDRLVVVNRNPARRNALTPGFQTGLAEALRRAADLPRLGAVIVTGEGGFFCAGGDLSFLMRAQEMTEPERRAAIMDLAGLIRAVHDCPSPVIAAVEGGAAGAGLSLALACDMIVAAEDAKFSAAYVSAGLVPDAGLTAALTAALPPQLAAEMCLTGAPVAAARLHALGVVNRLVPPGTVLDVAREAASRLAQGPAEAQAAIKTLLTGARRATLEAQFEAEAGAMARALGAPEAAEGIAAFLGKRPADFAARRRGE